MDVEATRPTRYAVRYLSRNTSANVIPVMGNRAAEALFSDSYGAEMFCDAVKRDGGLVFEVVSRNGE